MKFYNEDEMKCSIKAHPEILSKALNISIISDLIFKEFPVPKYVNGKNPDYIDLLVIEDDTGIANIIETKLAKLLDASPASTTQQISGYKSFLIQDSNANSLRSSRYSLIQNIIPFNKLTNNLIKGRVGIVLISDHFRPDTLSFFKSYNYSLGHKIKLFEITKEGNNNEYSLKKISRYLGISLYTTNNTKERVVYFYNNYYDTIEKKLPKFDMPKNKKVFQIRPGDWIQCTHVEYMDQKNGCFIQLHLESRDGYLYNKDEALKFFDLIISQCSSVNGYNMTIYNKDLDYPRLGIKLERGSDLDDICDNLIEFASKICPIANSDYDNTISKIYTKIPKF